MTWSTPFPTAPCDPDGWIELLIRQHGIVTRRQLLRHGFTDSAIRANVRARRWAQVHDGVYAVFTGPLTEDARSHAPPLHHGDDPSPRAQLAGRGRVVLGFEETAADPCARAREVAAVLRRRGWAGALRACERCWSP